MNKVHILIVEDEVIVSMHLRSVLTNFGYEVTTVTGTGQEAVERAGSLRPDLILMDIALPGGMTGIEAAKIIKDRFDIPVVYVTGNADIPTVHRARETEPYGYVMKPVNMPDLFSTIDTALHRHKLQVRLKESEERYRRITQAVTDYIFTVRVQDGRAAETTHGPACEAVTGYAAEEFASDPGLWINMVHEDDREAVYRTSAKILDGKDSGPLEHRIWRKDGALRWVRNTPVPHRDEKGRLLSYDGLIKDITEQKLAEEALRESEARFRALVESTSDWIWAVDKNGRYTYSSPKVKDIIGYEPYEIIGKSIFHLLPREESSRLEETFKDIIKYPKPFFALENINIHKDGRHVTLESSGVPIFDEKGKFQGYRCIDRDITERKRSETALRESEERFRALVQNLQDIIVIARRDGTIAFENPATEMTLGYSLVGRNYIELMHPDDVPTAVKSFEQVANNENRHIPTMLRARHADGSWLYLEILATNLFDNTSIQGMLAVCRNVTERMMVQIALQASEERYRALFDQSPVGVFLFNNKLVITECNERLAQILQTSQETIIGLELDTLKDAEVIQKLREAIDGNVTFYEGPYSSTPGNIVLYISAVTSPLRDNHGNVVGGIAVMQDITDKKLAEEMLRASEERTRLLVENANVGIVVIKEWKVVFANPKFRELASYSFDEITSLNFLDFIHPDDRQIVAERYSQRMKGDDSFHNYEVRILGSNGSVRWTELNAMLLNWEGCPASLCFLNDIT